MPFWLGAIFAQLLGPWLGAITAARLVTVFWYLIGMWALWYAAYRLARREEAQPVALAFGGEATPRDYGRMLADLSVLFLTATFGVLVRVHETGAEPALLALVCIAMFGLAIRARRSVERLRRGRARHRRHSIDARPVAVECDARRCHCVHTLVR